MNITLKLRSVQIQSRLKVCIILAIPQLLWGYETIRYKKTTDSRSEIHETHSRTQLIEV